MDPDNLDLSVQPHEDGFCLVARMFYPALEGGAPVLRQERHRILPDEGQWESEEEAQEAAEQLRRWWAEQ